AAEPWFAKAWDEFRVKGDSRGQCLTVARAVLVKVGSWRTHERLEEWTTRAAAIAGLALPDLSTDEGILVRLGLLRGLDFADTTGPAKEAADRLAGELLDMLSGPRIPTHLRLMASDALIDHAVSIGQRDIFEKAVDGVAKELDGTGLPSL